jgi:cobalamin biosynthesis Mg chelatase CobN
MMADNEKRNTLKEDIVELIEKLDVLREKGFITSQAYEKRKTELLERL